MSDRSRIRRGRAIIYHPDDTEAVANPGDWVGVITDVNSDGSIDALVDMPNAPTVGSALTAMATADIAAFTDPPAAGEMALLRTFVNELKANANLSVALVNQLRTATAGLRKSGLTRGSAAGQYELGPVEG